MDPSYPIAIPYQGSLFGAGSSGSSPFLSTPSARSSTVDSSSPYGITDPRPHPISNIMFSGGQPPPIQPSFAGRLQHGLGGRSAQAGPSRQPYETPLGNLPPVPESHLSTFVSFASGPVGLPRNIGPFIPPGRAPWQENINDNLDFSGLSGTSFDGGSSSFPAHPQQHSLGNEQQQSSGSGGLSGRAELSASSNYNNFTPVPRTDKNPSMDTHEYPNSAIYPANVYSDFAPERSNWDLGQGGKEISHAECTEAAAIYEHLLSSLPHFLPSRQDQQDASPTLQPLIDLAAEGLAIFSGRPHQPTYHSPQPDRSESMVLPPPPSVPPVSRKGTGNGKEKQNTKCLGCGATETPEWRRGPMGPRTLCNACGLVHMKLQRKRKKQEEKAAAAAAAGGQNTSGSVNGVKGKKFKRDDGG